MLSGVDVAYPETWFSNDAACGNTVTAARTANPEVLKKSFSDLGVRCEGCPTYIALTGKSNSMFTTLSLTAKLRPSMTTPEYTTFSGMCTFFQSSGPAGCG